MKNIKSIITISSIASFIVFAPVSARAELGAGSLAGVSAGVGCSGQYGNEGWSCPPSMTEIGNAGPLAVASAGTSGASVFGPANSSTGSARASYGSIGASISANANSLSPIGATSRHTFGSAGGVAGAQWVDKITMIDPLLTGQKGTFTVPIALSGSVNASSTASAIGLASMDSFSAAVNFGINVYDAKGTTRLTYVTAHADTYFDRVSGGVYRGDSFPESLLLTVPFIWGTPIWIDMKLSVTADATVDTPRLLPDDPYFGFPRSGVASASFGHTATWGGISSVLDATGAPVTQFSVASLSGADYRQDFAAAVPEPQESAMMLAGLAFLGMLIRRRKQASIPDFRR